MVRFSFVVFPELEEDKIKLKAKGKRLGFEKNPSIQLSGLMINWLSPPEFTERTSAEVKDKKVKTSKNTKKKKYFLSIIFNLNK